MKKTLNSNQKNMLCGLGVCLVAAFLFYYTHTSIKVNAFITGYGTNSQTVPSIIFGFMFLMGILLIINSALRNKRGFENKKEFKWIRKEDWKRMAVVVGTIVVYTILTQIVGYFVTTAVYMMFLFWYTKVSMKVAAILTVCVEIGLYLLFVVVLNVPITMNVLLL